MKLGLLMPQTPFYTMFLTHTVQMKQDY